MPLPSSDTNVLLRARMRALTNRWRTADPGLRRLIGGGALATLAILLVLGHLSAPALMLPPLQTATPTGLEPRASTVAGQAAMEAAFWLACFISAVFSFRVMELLFRRDDIRIVSSLPLSPRALYLDRLMYGTGEALIWGAVPAVFFVPLCWHDGAWACVSAAALCVVTPLVTLGAGVGAQLFAGATEFGVTRDAAGRPVVDGYGGAGQLFIFAPGAALAISIVLVLLSKLGLQEMLRLQAPNRATSLGVGLAIGVAAVGVILGWRYFKKHYYRMLAGFREADFVGFEAPLDYQTSAFDTARRLESLLSEEARGVYRRHILQYGRRFALLRYGYPIAWLLYGVGAFTFSAAALPDWGMASAPLVVLALLVNPWTRLRTEGIHTSPMQALPVSPRAEREARDLFALREMAMFVTPFALILIIGRVVRGEEIAAAATATAIVIVGGLAMWGAQKAFGATHRGDNTSLIHVVSAIVALTILGASAASLTAGIITAGVLAATGAGLGHALTPSPRAPKATS